MKTGRHLAFACTYHRETLMPPRKKKVIKTCGCGRSYTRAEWEKLHFVGVQETESSRTRYRLEMRNCICRSTIGVETSTPLRKS